MYLRLNCKKYETITGKKNFKNFCKSYVLRDATSILFFSGKIRRNRIRNFVKFKTILFRANKLKLKSQQFSFLTLGYPLWQKRKKNIFTSTPWLQVYMPKERKKTIFKVLNLNARTIFSVAVLPCCK
jgi:hypothetical protein